MQLNATTKIQAWAIYLVENAPFATAVSLLPKAALSVAVDEFYDGLCGCTIAETANLSMSPFRPSH